MYAFTEGFIHRYKYTYTYVSKYIITYIYAFTINVQSILCNDHKVGSNKVMQFFFFCIPCFYKLFLSWMLLLILKFPKLCVCTCACMHVCVYVLMYECPHAYLCMFCSVLQCVAVCWCVLQCIAVCCSVLQCADMFAMINRLDEMPDLFLICSLLLYVCCSVVQCVAVCCSVLHYSLQSIDSTR